MSFDFSTLITDRKKSDADYARALIDRITDGTATAEELAEWNSATLKGVYDYTDLNRVTAAMDEINSMLLSAGYKAEYQPVDVHPIKIDENTMFLLHGDTIEDSSIYKIPITNSGVQASSSKSKFGEKSLYFNGNSRILFPGNTINFGSNDFTIDWWEYCESGSKTRFNSAYTTGQKYGGMNIGYSGTYVYCGSSFNSNYDLINGRTMLNVSVNIWVHWAVVRHKNNLYVYRNGVLFSSSPISGSIAYSAEYKMVIGDHREGDHNYFKGYIDEFRISNVARWTSNFTPPSEPYSIYSSVETEKDPYTWYESDSPPLPQLTQYLENVIALRSAIANISPEVPKVKDMFSVEAANNIEKILLSIEHAIQIMKQTYVPCGATACGGDYL